MEKGVAYRRGDVDLGDWAKLELKFWVGDKQSIVTPPMMRGLLELQEAILRTRFLAIESSNDLRGLSQEERDAYEFEVVVSPGSSILEVDITEIAKHFIGEMVDTMPPEYVLIVGLAAILAWVGGSSWRAWLESRKDERLAQIEAGREQSLLDAQRFATETDLKRWEIFAQAQQKIPAIAEIERAVEKGRLGLLKAAARTDGSKIAGRLVSPEVAQQLSQTPLSDEETETLTDTFDVLAVDSSVREGFRIRLQRRTDGAKFYASVGDALLSERDIGILQQAEWKKIGVVVQVALARRNDSIVRARIEHVIGLEGYVDSRDNIG